MNQTSLSAVLTFLALGMMIGGFAAWRQWYSPKGYSLAVWGSVLVSAGAWLAVLRRFT